MSRIGRSPIELPAGVSVAISPGRVMVNGPLGELSRDVPQRMTIEQVFHDVKEVEGLGQPQLRDIHANVGAVQATLWEFTLVELWSWDQPHEAICDRSGSPWDDAGWRPSHADRRKALQRWCLGQEFQQVCEGQPVRPEMRQFVERLLERAA